MSETPRKLIISPFQVRKLAEKNPDTLPLLKEIVGLNAEIEKLITLFNSSLIGVNEKIQKQYKDLLTTFENKLNAVESQKKIPGPKGDSYVITMEDKQAIAELIKVPVVNKIIERTEVVRETPVVKSVITETIPEEKIQGIKDSIEKDLPSLGTFIRDGLELLKGDDRLDWTAIKGLKEILDRLEKIRSAERVISASGRGHIINYDLSSQLNGVKKTFQLPANWTIISVVSSSFPNAFRPIIDYTFTPTSITFTNEVNAASTLAAGQTLIVIYEES